VRVLTIIKTSTGGDWLAPLLAGLVQRGHEVRVLLPDPAGSLGLLLEDRGIAVAGLPVPVAGARPFGLVKGFRELRRLVVDWQPHVVHYQLYLSALIGRAVTIGLRDTATVHMVPGPLYLEQPLIRMVERLLCRRDRAVIAASEYTYDLYRRMGYPVERLHYIPYATDLRQFRPASRDERLRARGTLGVPEGAFVAVCVAYFYPPRRFIFHGLGVKGHDVLLRGWAQYRRDGGDGFLLLVGDGWGERGQAYLREMKDLATALGIAESVVWTGYLADPRLAYRAADVSVAPSRSENHGSAVEAAGMGLPTIASRAGGLPEVVSDGDTGWLFASGDASALADRLGAARNAVADGSAREMGERARNAIATIYDDTTSVARFCEVVEQWGPGTESEGS